MIRNLKLLGGLLLAATLAACGGGGGSSGSTNGSTGGSTTPAPVAAAIEVFTSSPELTSASNSSLSFTVVVKDASNVAMPGQTVTFSASSGNLTGALPTPATGSAGEAITTVSLSPGADRANRDITVTLKSGSVSKDIKIPVVGTAVSLAGDSSILLNGVTTFTVKAADSAGQPVSNATLTLASSLGNTLAPASLTTNAQGAATFVYTGAKAGSDRLTVTGLGTSAAAAINVSADEFRFESPVADSTVAVGGSQTVTVRFLRSGAPVSGQTVSFSTTRGTITPSSARTDSNGRVSAVIASTNSGPASIVAQIPTSQVTLPLQYVALVANMLSLQANPGAIPPNTTGSSTNQATLQATVRDPAGNPVAGRVVNFTAISDPSNGNISPGSSVTDSAGRATAQFIPGPLTTGNNQVVFQATVQGTAVSGQTAMTVSSAALFISIGTGNEVIIPSSTNTLYEKEFSVYVTDANGAPAANRVINLSYFPDYYVKGSLGWGGKSWSYGSFGTCVNEDRNRNGVLDPGEDANGNGKLDPGLPVVVAPPTVTTEANGFAIFKLQYGKNYVPWILGTLTARAAVGGTESVRTQAYNLEGASTDFSSETRAPAGVDSPFGTALDCSTPN